MTEKERIKYAYECMIKNNPDEAVKLLLLKDKMIINKRRKITKAIEYIEERQVGLNIYGITPLLNILEGSENNEI